MSTSEVPAGITINTAYHSVDKNQDLVLKLFHAYYRIHQHSGKLFEELPDFFLVRPAVLANKDIATRSSDKLIIDDCVQRASARNGYIGVIKHRNPKLNYYWLELVPMPFMLGDTVTEDNDGSFYFILSHFVEYAKQNPKLYGDITAEIDSDKDLALMLKEINRLGGKLRPLLSIYSEDQLVSFNRHWPVAEVKKLLDALKDNEQSWCEVFFEYLIYVMGHKTKA
jgi:hypothetical protein